MQMQSVLQPMQIHSVPQPLPGPLSICFQYTWKCMECPMKNHRGSLKCGSCGHKPGADSSSSTLSVHESATSTSNASLVDIVSNGMGDQVQISELAYQPSYTDMDAALSRYYSQLGRKYKNQFATLCEENRCTQRLAECIQNGTLSNFDCNIPFVTEPGDRYRATAALLRSIYRNPFIDFAAVQSDSVSSHASKTWICSECSSDNDLLHSLQCQICFSPYDPSTTVVIEPSALTTHLKASNHSNDTKKGRSVTHSYPLHRADKETLHYVAYAFFRDCAAGSNLTHLPDSLRCLIVDFSFIDFEFENNGHGIEIRNRTTCIRTGSFNGPNPMENCFGSLVVGYGEHDTFNRFRWKLRRSGTGAVRIGFSPLENGSRYIFNESWSGEDGNVVTVELRWVRTQSGLQCQSMFCGQLLQLPPHQKYKLVVALGNHVAVTCIQYSEYAL